MTNGRSLGSAVTVFDDLPTWAKWAIGFGAIGLAWLIAQLTLPMGAPAGRVLSGATLGAATALTSLGLILIYRSNRVVNFAYGAMGAATGVASIRLFLIWHWNYGLAISVGVLLGVVLGGLTELLIIRRFERASRLVLTVATIGLAQLLGGIEILLPSWVFGDKSAVTFAGFDTPLSKYHVTVGVDIINGNHFLILAVVPIVLAGLGWFMTRSQAGAAIRAAAENSDRARLLGIPVRRMQFLVWSIAGGLATLTLLLKAPFEGTPPTVALGPAVLIPAFAAAVIARMESFPVAVVASLVLGAVDNIVRWNSSTPELVDVVMLGILLVALLLQRSGRSRAHDGDTGWQDNATARSVPSQLNRLPEVRGTRIAILIACVAAAVILPLQLDLPALITLNVATIWAIVALSIVVLTGWNGQVSLGQFAFAGCGALMAGNLMAHWNVDYFIALAAAAAVGAVAAFIVGFPALRIQGPFLAVVTLSFAVVVNDYLNPNRLPSVVPQEVPRPVLWGRWPLESQRTFCYFALATFAFVFLCVRGVRRARSGRVLMAGRDNRKAAEAMSVSTRRTALNGFLFSGAIAGLAGGLHVVLLGGINTGQYVAVQSVNVFAMSTIGGLASPGGASAGAATLRSLLDNSGLQLVLMGVGLLVVLYAIPGGLAGLMFGIRDRLLRRVARRRRIAVAGLGVDAFEGPPAELEELDAAAQLALETAMALDDVAVDDNEPAVEPHNGVSSHIGSNGSTYPIEPTEPPERGRPATVSRPGLSSEPETVPPLLECTGTDVSYGQLQVLFGVDFAVAEGEMVALLGTNGAGKSTLLKALSGLIPSKGRVRFGGRDIRGRHPEKIVRDGVALMPGGKSIFPTLDVAEHLRLATWTFRHDRARIAADRERVLEIFPSLRKRLATLAGDLSGGEQQQLALAQTLLLRPRVLLIDELSLGLAPTIVALLLDVVRSLNEAGTTVVVVEQSVNVALSLADRAVFMEKGQVRFEGPTRDLLDRPDILRSVFLEGAAALGDDQFQAGNGSAEGRPGVAMPTVDLAHLSDLRAMERATSDRPEQPVLECRSVVKRFGGVIAVDHVDLVVRPGEIVGLVGQNGAGKTTLVDCVSGFHRLDGGSIVFRGYDVTDWYPFERARGRLGRSFQEARLFPSLTVTETISVACERHAASKALIADAFRQPASYESELDLAARTESLVDLLGLADHRDKLTSELSTGTRRIVELACLLAEDPVLLLLDEPSAGVAQKESESLGPLLRRICDMTGAAMLIIEHDMPLLAGICDRLVALDLGAVIAEGPSNEVLADELVVASYLGMDSTAINRSGATRS